jgi:hypothetical protein
LTLGVSTVIANTQKLVIEALVAPGGDVAKNTTKLAQREMAAVAAVVATTAVRRGRCSGRWGRQLARCRRLLWAGCTTPTASL